MGELYNFNPSDAEDFARFVSASTKYKGDELEFKYCPYCNGGQHKDKYSFSINLKTGMFSCLRSSCNATGNMITLARDYDFSLGNKIDPYYKPDTYKWRKFKTKAADIVEIKDEVIDYFCDKRKISKEVVDRYKLQLKKESTNIVAFPFLDPDGALTFVKYRKTDFDPNVDKNKEWCEADCKPILFGMYQCNLDNKTLIMTEGQIDSLSVATSGYENAVSVPNGCNGFTWIPHCWDWLKRFDTLIVFGDYERGQMTLLDEMSKRFDGLVKHVRYEDYKDCKDANAILCKYGADQIKVCIDNAIPLPISHVKKISDIQIKNIDKIQKVGTSLSQLNKLLSGGFTLGGVVIIGGKTGEGKSILSSQIVANAMYEGHKVFIYSGELPNDIVKLWLYYQICGNDMVEIRKDQYGNDEALISDHNIKIIDQWVDDKAYIFDSTIISNDEELELIKYVEDAIRQYGVDVILIDNLMTAMYLDETKGSDIYEKQSRFVIKLVDLAQRYNVLILLVAHKKKNSGDDENESISGSSNITNLATLTLFYSKPDQKDLENETMSEDQRRIRVAKNRITGKTTSQNGFILNYDPMSRRIYGSGDNPKPSLIGEFLEVDSESMSLPFEWGGNDG